MHTCTAKDIVVAPIDRADADRTIKRYHYSGKVVNNSQFHVGVFLGGKLEGAMSFGPSLDKRKIVGLVSGTGWNEFIELNRMAFSDRLPRNSESRALAVTFRMMRKFAPHLKWVISFADGTQSGDGTIYRAAGFVLTSIKENNQIWEAPTGEMVSRHEATNHNPGSGRDRIVALANEAGARESRTSLTDGRSKRQQAEARRLSRASMTMKGNNGATAQRRELIESGVITETGAASMRSFIEAGFKPLPGFQLRYIYFLDPTARERLTVPILPFSEIERRGAGMYRGKSRAASADGGTPGIQPGGSGSTPTAALVESEGA